MDRIQFIGQTHQGNMVSIDDIIEYFDHTMAAYEVVGGVDKAIVHGEPDDRQHSLKIQVESPNTSELGDVVTYINETLHNRQDIYGRSFNIEATIEGPIVELFVREINIY